MSRAKFSLIVVISFFSLLVSLIVIELATSVYRGYGFIGAISRMPPCNKDTKDDLRKVVNFIEQVDDNSVWLPWPDAELIAQNVPTVKFDTDQPYRDYGILIFKSTTHNEKYFYSRANMTNNKPNSFDPNYVGIVKLCNMARWEGPMGIYHSYKKYPKFVRKYIKEEMGGEKWTCCTTIIGFGDMYCDCPPIPGALMFMQRPDAYFGLLNVKYPENILPVAKKIYPNLIIKNENILEQ